MNIAIIGHFTFADDSAASLRVRGVAAALLQAGHRVTIVDHAAGGPVSGQPWRMDSLDGTSFEGVSLDNYRDGKFGRGPAGFRGLFLGDTPAGWLCERQERPDLIIVYGTHLGFLLRLQPLCKRLGIPIVLDVVEWYAAQDLPLGRFGPFALSNSIAMRWISQRADGVIAISRRLEQHYRKRGLPVLRLPPLFATTALQPKWSEEAGALSLCYAGSPGQKEAFDVIAQAMMAAGKAGSRVSFEIVGVTQERWQALAGTTDFGDATVRCWGRVPNARAREIVASCNYSLVIRRPRRSNQFGFPSKYAESLSLGTPVIANEFSDIGEDRDSSAVMMIDHLSSKDLTAAILQAEALPRAKKQESSRAALSLAKRKYSPRSQAEKLDAFLVKTADGLRAQCAQKLFE